MRIEFESSELLVHALKLGLYLESEVEGLLDRVPGPYFEREPES